ncbi:unnamed protein product [Lupinus luteus]|uniref:TF-B3 domain-containing protein n=1 Tax=Lupinus luteus TaxID=3873 RepID=A0AAV1X212_LUPLU
MAKGCANNTYEEARKQRLEENKKRFEDLGISKISKNLTEVTTPVKKTHHHLPKSKSKTNDVVEPRRSSRVRNPITSYSEDVGIDLPTLRKRSRSNSSSCYSYIARPLDEIKHASDKQRSRAWEGAEELLTNLQSENPTFIKSMVRSHVYSCFWLGLPSKFCEDHLPKTHYNMILEDENGSEYDAVYIGSRSGLSGGWRAFALEHKLDDGDALVFELIEPARFKIYTVKAFPESIEEDEKEESEEKEGNTRATRALKAGSNGETKSKKTRKSKQATVNETNESESSQENLPQSRIDNEVKAQEVSPTKITVSQEKMQRKSKRLASGESKVEAQVESVKPKGKNLVKPRGVNPGKTRKATKNQDVGELMDVEPVEEASKDDSHVESVKPEANSIVNPRGAKPSKKPKSTDNLVQDAGELEKVEPLEEARKCVSQKPQKRAAGKLFRKRA